MLLNKHQRRQKEVLRVQRELSELYARKWNLGWTKLEKPMQRGYKQYFVLHDEVKRRPDAEAIAHVLHLINATTYSKSPNFTHRVGKLVKECRAPRLKGVSKEVYASLTPRQQKFLRATQPSDHHYCLECQSGIYGMHYHFRYPWMVKTVIKPHFVTHVKNFDAALEKAIGEREKHQRDHQDWVILSHMKGQHPSRWEPDWNDRMFKARYGKNNASVKQSFQDFEEQEEFKQAYYENPPEFFDEDALHEPVWSICRTHMD